VDIKIEASVATSSPFGKSLFGPTFDESDNHDNLALGESKLNVVLVVRHIFAQINL
jgi:hypothetical protein